MNLSPLWVLFFRQNGFHAVHWSTVGAANSSDAEMMTYAEANQFVIFTPDLDFGALLATRKAKGPSVIQIRTQDVFPSLELTEDQVCFDFQHCPGDPNSAWISG